MTDTSASQNPTVAVREGEGLDVAAIDRALKEAVPDLSGTPLVTQYDSGASNLTYALDYPGRRLVLRRPPFGPLPKGGHNMQREYRVMRDLKPVFPAVPKTVFYTDDTAIIGAEFYVMERAEGHLIHNQIPAGWNWRAGEVRALCEAFFDKFVELHMVDYKAIGMEDFGRPEGYVARQISGWNRRFEKAWTDDIETFEDVREWLDANQPATESGASIIHGDYRIDNCILKLEDPTQIEAILDWEISALGDPLMDLGNTLAYWIEQDDPPSMQLLAKQPSQADGMMTRREVAEFYAAKTGRDVSNIQFYYVYGLFRLAVIVQQIYARFYRGQTDNPKFRDYGKLSNALGQVARERIQSGML